MLWLLGVVLFWFALVWVGLTVVFPIVGGFVEALFGTGVGVPFEVTGAVEDVVMLSVVGDGEVLSFCPCTTKLMI